MTPAKIANVIAKLGQDAAYVNVGPTLKAPDLIYINLSDKPAGFVLLFHRAPKLSRDKAALFKAMGGKVTPDRVAIDPFTREQETIKGSHTLHAKTAQEAADLCFRVFVELFEYPQKVTLRAEEGLD